MSEKSRTNRLPIILGNKVEYWWMVIGSSYLCNFLSTIHLIGADQVNVVENKEEQKEKMEKWRNYYEDGNNGCRIYCKIERNGEQQGFYYVTWNFWVLAMVEDLCTISKMKSSRLGGKSLVSFSVSRELWNPSSFSGKLSDKISKIQTFSSSTEAPRVSIYRRCGGLVLFLVSFFSSMVPYCVCAQFGMEESPFSFLSGADHKCICACASRLWWVARGWCCPPPFLFYIIYGISFFVSTNDYMQRVDMGSAPN